MKKYPGTTILGDRARSLVMYELVRIEEDGDVIDAILGRDVLENYRVTLDWLRMDGSLAA